MFTCFPEPATSWEQCTHLPRLRSCASFSLLPFTWHFHPVICHLSDRECDGFDFILSLFPYFFLHLFIYFLFEVYYEEVDQSDIFTTTSYYMTPSPSPASPLNLPTLMFIEILNMCLFIVQLVSRLLGCSADYIPPSLASYILTNKFLCLWKPPIRYWCFMQKTGGSGCYFVCV